ncbi:tetratricopeptide repeat protein [Actinomadura madurae]|uniref:tetratricopeptide repeat protein n=3 Tax=Actinomadura madurae TaxID=1993 RepID=UPI0020276400|nr:tetratricopeptide repeat protein [Actinomadura madurae]URM93104.1 tetratricopeptide repeat protein [Actinomadura madurae]
MIDATDSDDGAETAPDSPHAPVPRPAACFHDQVHADDIVAGDKIVHYPAPRFAPPIRQLPAAPRDFVGREDELAVLDAAFASAREAGSVTVAHIHGMAGAGKTALVLHWAHQHADRFEDQFFLDMGGPAARTPGRALRRFLEDLGVAARDIPSDEARCAALFRSLVAVRRVLVVLDDAADADQVVPLVPGGAGSLVVVTGRTRLEALIARFGAVSIPVGPLSIADSWRLLARLLGGERSKEEPRAIADLAESCARLPLAIRIAAVGLEAGPFDSVASLVGELTCGGRLDALVLDGDPELALRSAFDLSYDNLTPREQAAFRLLGLMRGLDFGAESLAALLAVTVREARGVLRGLIRKHLVEPGTAGRFRLHELLAEYAAERLAREDRPGAEAATGRLQDWYLARLREAAKAIAPTAVGPASGAAGGTPRPAEPELAWFERERAAVVAVARRAAEGAGPHLAWQFADALFQLLRRDKHAADNLAVHRLGLAAARAARDRHPEALMLDQLAVVHCDAGDHVEAAKEAREAYEIFTELGDHRRAGWALNTRSRVERQCSRYQEALEYGERALAVLTREGDRQGIGQALEQIAQVHWRLAHYRTALRHARESLRVHRELGGGAGEADALEMIARILRRLGLTGHALRYAERALAVRRRLGDRRGQGAVLDGMCRALRRGGRLKEALACARESVAVREDIGDLTGLAVSLLGRAQVLENLGDCPAAFDDASRALRICRDVGDLYGEAESLCTIAVFHHDSGQYQAAMRHARHALAIRKRIGDEHGVASVLNLIALVERRLGRHADARRDVESALALQRRMKAGSGLGRTLNNLAEIERSAGRYGEALVHARAALERHTRKGAGRAARIGQGRASPPSRGSSAGWAITGRPGATRRRRCASSRTPVTGPARA